MNLRAALHALAERHDLDAVASQRLIALAAPGAEPPGLAPRLPLGLAVAAAALCGLGLVTWVAANWGELGRVGRFALLQAAVVAAAAAAALRPALRAPGGLAALLAVGALFASFGQTYQTGVDAWQFFALWAALALPLALAARSDVLWAPWALVAMTAIALWARTHTGHAWRVDLRDLPTHAIALALALAVVLALGPGLRRLTGAGAWSRRTAFTLFVVMVVSAGIGALFAQPVAPHYWLALAVLAVGAALHARRAGFDVYALSAAALGLDTLLVGGLARLLLEDLDESGVAGSLMLVGLVAAGLLAGSVKLVLQLARRHGTPPGGAMAPHALGPFSAAAASTSPEPAQERPPAPGASPGDAQSGRAPAAPSEADRSPEPDWLCRARACGLLPPDASVAEASARPWPVVLLTALGAWLAALPILASLGALLGPWLDDTVGGVVVGLLALAAAVAVLRRPGQGLFVEQLAVPLLLTGGASLGLALFRELPTAAAAALLGLLALALAWALTQPWLRTLLGAAACLLAGVAGGALVAQHLKEMSALAPQWGLVHGLLAIWLGALWWQQRRLEPSGRTGHAAWLEAVATGWLAMLLLGLASSAGTSFLVGGVMGGFSDVAGVMAGRHGGVGAGLAAASCGLALAAAGVASRAWPTLRAWPLAGAALVIAALAALMPMLGAALLALAVTLTTGRQGLAGAAAFVAAWIVGAFYYQLAWPLTDKAAALAAAGVLLGALALALRRGPGARGRAATDPAPAAASVRPGRAAPADRAPPHAPARPRHWLAPWLVALAAAATLGVVNLGIRDKETLIAQGRPVYVELAPVDPRSLMQGDYMRLAFRLPDASALDAYQLLGARRPQVAARLDARGVATLDRVLAHGSEPEPGELRIELTPKDGDWVLVTDGWFFAEGEAERWAKARYGEFRVEADGRALLVGMADEALRPIGAR